MLLLEIVFNMAKAHTRFYSWCLRSEQLHLQCYSIIASDASDWGIRVSSVARNGMKKGGMVLLFLVVTLPFAHAGSTDTL